MYKIYCINHISGLCYIGKTKQSLKKRLWKHRKARDLGQYCSSQKLDLDNCEMILLEECEKDIASEREQYWMERYPNRVNDRNAIFGSKKEYMKQYAINNKERRKQYYKQYSINNKEKRKLYDKQYNINREVKKCINDIIDEVILMS